MEAIYSFFLGDYVKCRDLALEVVNSMGKSRVLLAGYLGKAFLKLGDFKSALSCFEQAQKLSPQNMCRLIQMAEINLELGDEKAACIQAEEAYRLDPTDPKMASRSTEVLTACGNAKLAARILSELENGDAYVAKMNNRAISLARVGKFEESISLYEKTLSVLGKKFANLAERITYNLALAHARYGDLEEALAIVDRLSGNLGSEIYPKVTSLQRKLTRSLSTGASLQLVTKAEETLEGLANTPFDVGSREREKELRDESPGQASIVNELALRLKIRKGDFCCHLLFCDKGVESYKGGNRDVLLKLRVKISK